MHTVPFSGDLLRQIIVGEIKAPVVDYKNSTIKGKNLITYLSNLNIPDIVINFEDVGVDEKKTLLVEYIKHQSQCNVPQLIATLLKCLLAVKRFELSKLDLSELDKQYFEASILSNNEIYDLINEEQKLFLNVVDVLDGILLYAITNLTMYKEACGDEPDFVHVEGQQILGKTFVNLLEDETFNSHYYAVLPKFEELKYYNHYFDRPIYSGKTLMSYMGGSCLIFPMLKMITEQTFDVNQLDQIYLETDAALI